MSLCGEMNVCVTSQMLYSCSFTFHAICMAQNVSATSGEFGFRLPRRMNSSITCRAVTRRCGSNTNAVPKENASPFPSIPTNLKAISEKSLSLFGTSRNRDNWLLLIRSFDLLVRDCYGLRRFSTLAYTAASILMRGADVEVFHRCDADDGRQEGRRA